jgi:excisionase family DNA binding protein
MELANLGKLKIYLLLKFYLYIIILIGINIGKNKRKDRRMAELDKHRLLSRKEAAEFLGVKTITLAIWKSTQRHDIPVVKVGRLARYRFEDLLAFVEKRTISQPANQNKKGTDNIPPHSR